MYIHLYFANFFFGKLRNILGRKFTPDNFRSSDFIHDHAGPTKRLTSGLCLQ